MWPLELIRAADPAIYLHDKMILKKSKVRGWHISLAYRSDRCFILSEHSTATYSHWLYIYFSAWLGVWLKHINHNQIWQLVQQPYTDVHLVILNLYYKGHKWPHFLWLCEVKKVIMNWSFSLPLPPLWSSSHRTTSSSPYPLSLCLHTCFKLQFWMSTM